MAPADERGAVLLGIARRSIEHALGGPDVPLPSDDWLQDSGATFVTITRRGRLHGCIGNIEALRSIGTDVQKNAVLAALSDPRSRPLRREELAEVRLEVSLLSPLAEIHFETEAEALGEIKMGQDGIVFCCGERRATFLPQVWQNFDSVETFIRELKRKAGLADDFWSPDVRLFRYASQKWREPSA